jgi:hypothetical protein
MGARCIEFPCQLNDILKTSIPDSIKADIIRACSVLLYFFFFSISMFTLFHTNIHSVKYHILDNGARRFTTILFDFVLLYMVYMKKKEIKHTYSASPKNDEKCGCKNPFMIYPVYIMPIIEI